MARVRFSDHKLYQYYTTEADARVNGKRKIERYPEYYWRVRRCTWQYNGHRDSHRTPHYHVIPEPHAKDKKKAD